MCRLGGFLGKGQFALVHKAVWASRCGEIDVAVKELKRGASDQDRVKFLREAAIMGQFNHTGIIKLYGVVKEKKPVSVWHCVVYCVWVWVCCWIELLCSLYMTTSPPAKHTYLLLSLHFKGPSLFATTLELPHFFLIMALLANRTWSVFDTPCMVGVPYIVTAFY